MTDSQPKSVEGVSQSARGDSCESAGDAPITRRRGLASKISYAAPWLPSYAWQRLTRRVPQGPVHLIFAIADHFEPAIVPENGYARAPYEEQEKRLERWCREYPKLIDQWRDVDGYPLVHSYFYPAEQYDKGHLDRLAEHCHAGWGEVEIHLHHGTTRPDTAENLRRELSQFRDTLAFEHGCLSYFDGVGTPQYGFVHGNFALANSAGGFACGVDSEIQVLADTGCYADMTLPTGAFHPAQTSKINSIYECGVPLSQRASHRRGRDLESGRKPQIFPLIVQGPLMLDFGRSGNGRTGKFAAIENGALTPPNPPSLHRLNLWKDAAISVHGRPDWLFIKLHCHSMDPTQEPAVLGEPMRKFLRELVESAKQRSETIHFASAREMVNIILAACDGREGNPGDYRDYRLKRIRKSRSTSSLPLQIPNVAVKG
ncbi:MAG: hypothetical protein JWO91_263 [Acidobacteriaceae bacterium]|nr:hypothetical protein [Acidobacteriaceae bacterium]